MTINPIDNLVNNVLSKLPQGSNQLRDDLSHTLKANLMAGLKKMDLVTRDEFDAQTAVLAKTREKLNLLEQKLALLEKNYNS